MFFPYFSGTFKIRCGMGLRPVRRVGIFFLEAISPWWSRSQNHRDISFPNISGDPVRRVCFRFPGNFVTNLNRTDRKDLNRTDRSNRKGRCRKRDHKRAVLQFKCRESLARRKIFHARLLRPESLAWKIFRRARLFHIPY